MAYFEVLKNGQQVSFGELENDKAIFFAFGYREALIRAGIAYSADMSPERQTIKHLDNYSNCMTMEVTGIK